MLASSVKHNKIEIYICNWRRRSINPFHDDFRKCKVKNRSPLQGGNPIHEKNKYKIWHLEIDPLVNLDQTLILILLKIDFELNWRSCKILHESFRLMWVMYMYNYMVNQWHFFKVVVVNISLWLNAWKMHFNYIIFRFEFSFSNIYNISWS